MCASGKERLRYLKSKPRRSLCRLQLKFAEGYAQMNFSASLSTSSVTQKYNYLESRRCDMYPESFLSNFWGAYL